MPQMHNLRQRERTASQMQPKYKRILLKLSGEAMAGQAHTGLDFDTVLHICKYVKEAAELGTEIAIVVGGGNFWRGRSSGKMDRTRADHMGMLATTINALGLADALNSWAARCVCRLPLRCMRWLSRTSVIVLCVTLRRAVS